jgi:enamine deaminase RidA (YjgF/YER057c/UK114 family)
MRGYRFSSLARESLFADVPQAPASSGLSIDGLPWKDASVSFDAIAAVPGTPSEKENLLPIHGIVATYVAATSAGPWVLTAGEVPISVSDDPTLPRARVIKADADLIGDGLLLSLGRVHHTDHYRARAWYVYHQLAGYLRAYDATLDDVVHQTVYLCDPTQYPDVERVASLYYGPTLPPTTVIPINDTSPFRDAGLEIEVIAHK